jgi:hypothetical protein
MERDSGRYRRTDILETPTEEAHKRGLLTGLLTGAIAGAILGGIFGALLERQSFVATPNQVGAAPSPQNRVLASPESPPDNTQRPIENPPSTPPR